MRHRRYLDSNELSHPTIGKKEKHVRVAGIDEIDKQQERETQRLVRLEQNDTLQRFYDSVKRAIFSIKTALFSIKISAS